MSLTEQRYRAWRLDLESDFESERKDLQDRLQRLEDQRRAAIEALNAAWPKMGGSPDDIAVFESESNTPSVSRLNGSQSPRDGDSEPDDYDARRLPKHILEQYIQDVLSDPEITIVTQTEVKKRILLSYSITKESLNYLRVMITTRLNELVEQGKLELMERARAGQPNKYAKIETAEEANLLGP